MNTCLKKGNVVKYLKSEFNGLPYGQWPNSSYCFCVGRGINICVLFVSGCPFCRLSSGLPLTAELSYLISKFTGIFIHHLPSSSKI
jgi:hypothetical protein